MLVIDSVEYESYMAVCEAYGIDYKEFLEYKARHGEEGELFLLGHFIEELAYRMSDGEYVVGENSEKGRGVE